MVPPIQTTSRSMLNNKAVKLVAFRFDKHPYHSGFVQISIYSISEEQHVFCVSEGPGKGDLESAKEALGTETLGVLIAPFAQRFLDGLPYEKLKEEFSKDGKKWFWHK